MLQMKKHRLERNAIYYLRCLQFLQQFVKHLLVFRRITVPATEITNNFANDLCFAFVPPTVGDV